MISNAFDCYKLLVKHDLVMWGDGSSNFGTIIKRLK